MQIFHQYSSHLHLQEWQIKGWQNTAMCQLHLATVTVLLGLERSVPPRAQGSPCRDYLCQTVLFAKESVTRGREWSLLERMNGEHSLPKCRVRIQ